MTTDLYFDAAHPVDDRYAPLGCGELDEIAEVMADGRLSGGAPVLATYERALASWFGIARAIAVNSGSSALHATLTALEVKPGTEVVVPATAPLPTAMPILTCGATPVIVDTLPGSLALDPADLAGKLTARTRAAIVLPLWGYPNDDHQAAALLGDAGVPVVDPGSAVGSHTWPGICGLSWANVRGAESGRVPTPFGLVSGVGQLGSNAETRGGGVMDSAW